MSEINYIELVKALDEAANEWVITHDGMRETSCGLVGLAREASHVITSLLARAEKAEAELLRYKPVCPRCGLENDRHIISNSCDRCGDKMVGAPKEDESNV